MTTQQLTGYVPRPFGGRALKRKLQLRRVRLQRLTRSSLRKVRSSSVMWYRRQYFLTNAYRDLRTASAKNEDIYLAILIIAVILGYAYAVVAAQILFIFFGAAYALGEATGMSMALLSLVTVCVLGVSLAWVGAFAANALSLSLMHGANRKQLRSLRRTLRQALHFTARTTAAWTLTVATVLGPLLVIALGTAVYVKATHTTSHAALRLLPYVGVVCLGWISYALTSFSLVPHVALFESHLSFQQAFARSRQLVSSKGKLFLGALYASLVVTLAALYGVSVLLEKVLRLNQSITFIFGIILSLILTNGLLTAFYRKRRLARK